MKKTFLLLSSVVLLLLCGSSLYAQNNSRSTYWHQKQTLFESLATSPEDIVMLGNSITDGGEWAEILDNVHVKNRGISGDTTDGVLQRLSSITDGKLDLRYSNDGLHLLGEGYKLWGSIIKSLI